MASPIDFPHRIGGDLLWWRAANGWSTHVTLFWPADPVFEDGVHIEAVLFDPRAQPAARWRFPLRRGRPVSVDSDRDGPWRAAGDVEGVLVLTVCTDAAPSPEALHHQRLFPFVDWCGPQGEVASLHSDQVLRPGRATCQEWTEIVVHESGHERNALIVLNGESPHAPGAIGLRVANSRGEARAARYDQPMAPFSLHRIELGALLPGLDAFAAGDPLVVSGTFASVGLFTRPYVETRGERYGVYHAGDLYHWDARPHFEHALIGGEVDPIPVIHDAQHRTSINVLHSHGDLDDDLAVDATLYDAEGRLVARKPAWRIARRHALARGDVAELLPRPDLPFRGHIALSFAPEPGRAVPRHLQALAQYTAPGSTAHVMTWSDEWNSPVRLALRDRDPSWPLARSWSRVLDAHGWDTHVSITNAGHDSGGRQADVTLELVDDSGTVAKQDFSLAPFATLCASCAELFPGAGRRRGALVASSANDLANMAFTHCRRSGRMSAEHFMPLPLRDAAGQWRIVAGS